MQEQKPKGINIVTKIWLIVIYSIFSFLLFTLVLLYLYYQNIESAIYNELDNTVSSIYYHLEDISYNDKYFYKKDSFKKYIRNLNISIKHNIYIANEKGIIASADNNGDNIVHKKFIKEIPPNSKYGEIQYTKNNKNYIIKYRNIKQSNIWLYFEIDKSHLLSLFIANIKKMLLLAIFLVIPMIALASLFSSSVKYSIKSLYSNITRFLRSRSVARIKIDYHDELYDIYSLFFNYSIKIQDASIKEDRLMIEAMEGVLDDLKDGDLSARINLDSKKEVLAKSRKIVNSIIDILNSHLSEILNTINSFNNNDFSATKKEAINKDLEHIYNSMNKLGIKFSNIANDNVEVAMEVEDNQYKITQNIQNLKNNFESQLNGIDDILDDVMDIYSRMDYNIDISKDIQSTSNDILNISKQYKDFSKDSMEYIDKTNNSHSLVNKYLNEIEYYSNKANILSVNTSIKSSRYGEISNIFHYFSQEFKDISEKFHTNINNIKKVIVENIELGKGFYALHDGLNYNSLVKKINQISSFARDIDNNTQAQFLKLSTLQENTEHLYDKNKMALQKAMNIQNTASSTQGLINRLVSFLNT